MTCGSALAACAASTPDAPTTNRSHRRPPGGDPACKQTVFRDLADMKPPLGQRPRSSASTARTRTPKFAPFSHPIRQPKDRGSMHPSRPREADWVARWRLGQRRARGTRRGRAGVGAVARAPPRENPSDGRGASAHAWRVRRPRERGDRRPRGASTTGVVKDYAQRLLVRINDVVDEPLTRGRMEHQKNDRPFRPIIQRHCRRNAGWAHPSSPRRI
jgi:hypothetical protein